MGINDRILQLHEEQNGVIIRANIDGIIDPIAYSKSNKTKICWILREATRGENSTGGINQAEEKKKLNALAEIKGDMGYITFLPIVALPEMLLKDDETYSPSWASQENAYKLFKETTAYINVKKIPDLGSRDTGKYKRLAKDCNNLALMEDQLCEINPDVIIFAGTFNGFNIKGKEGNLETIKSINSFSILGYEFDSSNIMESNNKCFAFYNDDVICISTYHPANRRVKRNDYLRNITSLINNIRKR